VAKWQTRQLEGLVP